MQLISRGRNLIGFHGRRNLSQWLSAMVINSAIRVKQLLEEKLGFCLLAEFPLEGVSSTLNKWLAVKHTVALSSPSQPSSHTSDGSGTLLSSSTESCYNSDQGSGNEDSQEASYIIYEESSDEVDFLVG